MPRNIDGHGLRITRKPPPFGLHGVPSFFTTAGRIPKNGIVQLPGFVVVAPGRGEIMIAPVSVCHHVSTIGQRPSPMTCWYQIHASGLIGSPTDPRTRSDDMSCAFGNASPHFMNARIAVGAV